MRIDLEDVKKLFEEIDPEMFGSIDSDRFEDPEFMQRLADDVTRVFYEYGIPYTPFDAVMICLYTQPNSDIMFWYRFSLLSLSVMLSLGAESVEENRELIIESDLRNLDMMKSALEKVQVLIDDCETTSKAMDRIKEIDDPLLKITLIMAIADLVNKGIKERIKEAYDAIVQGENSDS